MTRRSAAPASSTPTPRSSAATAAAGPAQTVDVIEFYNASLDHYFITYGAQEISDLDAGVRPRLGAHHLWLQGVHDARKRGTSPVCRFYIPPAQGDSHFFGRGHRGMQRHRGQVSDASSTRIRRSCRCSCRWRACVRRTRTEVYRVFSNRADANHRYMTDKAVRDADGGERLAGRRRRPRTSSSCARRCRRSAARAAHAATPKRNRDMRRQPDSHVARAASASRKTIPASAAGPANGAAAAR